MQERRPHLNILLQLDFNHVVLLAVPDALLVQLLLVVLHPLQAIDEILQLQTQEDRGVG